MDPGDAVARLALRRSTFNNERDPTVTTCVHPWIDGGDRKPASWGGMYSTSSAAMSEDAEVDPARQRLAGEMVDADAVELELAATALFVAGESTPDPWSETQRRKPDMAADGRLDGAKRLYRRLRLKPPELLPAL